MPGDGDGLREGARGGVELGVEVAAEARLGGEAAALERGALLGGCRPCKRLFAGTVRVELTGVIVKVDRDANGLLESDFTDGNCVDGLASLRLLGRLQVRLTRLDVGDLSAVLAAGLRRECGGVASEESHDGDEGGGGLHGGREELAWNDRRLT